MEVVLMLMIIAKKTTIKTSQADLINSKQAEAGTFPPFLSLLPPSPLSPSSLSFVLALVWAH
jgi:hypothetical protein